PGPSTEGERTFVQRPGTEAPGRPAAMAAPGPPRPAASPEREQPRQDEGRPAPPRPGAPAPPERRPPAWAGPGRQGATARPSGDRPEPDSGKDEQSAPRPAAAPPAAPASEAEQPGPLRPGVRPGLPPRPGAPATPGTPGVRAVVGGTSRPAPKPTSPTRPPERPAADDEDEDVLFDDLGPADELENAIEIDESEENRPSTSAGPGLRASPPPSPRPGTGPGLTRPGSPSRGAHRPGGDSSPKANPGSSGDSGKPSNPGNPGNPGHARPMAGSDGARRPDAALATAAKPEKVGGGSSKAPCPAWKLPPVDNMLDTKSKQSITDEELRQRAEIIETTLSSFGAPARVVEVNHGPVITQYGVEPDYVDGRAGKRIKVKVSKISSLADDLALALSAPTIRIEAPVPGKGYIGIEVPNLQPSIVGLKDVMDTPEFRNMKSPLRMALGQDVSGKPVVADLTSMPHLLIAGTTGSGKSVCVNGIIATFLMTCTPDQLKMIMVDPKRVELTNYNGIPHLLSPVVTELERIVGVLKWVQREMDDRYRKFAMQGARNITDYNTRVEQGKIKDEDPLPYIVVIVDELADLMMLAPDETERVITRLAQMARATGIHIILSTQRPSVDVVTGLIKANFPARIAFAVASGTDSRVILDTPGAEKLLGRGDMLFQPPDTPMPIRMQGTYVSDEEIQRITDFWREQAEKMPGGASSTGTATGTAVQKVLFSSDEDKDDEVDELFDEAVALVREKGKASISMLQRHLRIGYTRAARLIEAMEEMDIVSEHEGGSRQRNVLENGDEDE
ncbi:MAG TPA: DNA translocase FtsK, partial [Aggregatilineales bacterium]|nr:DNA translocase FtsK [Aggregatilineales bacterium]